MNVLQIGIDIGSTTIKIVAVDSNTKEIQFKRYVRHQAKIQETLINTLKELITVVGDREFTIAMTGSAALALSGRLNTLFVQEVIASTKAISSYIPETDVMIELGGEDAKICFFDAFGVEPRMNGSCAGGTGAFIDQMASLLNITPTELNDYAKDATEIYSVASRCGVFAKTDVQPLINQGARKEDISASVLQAVVNQTIGGLAQGKEIKGNIAFLGGPLTFLSELRNRFIITLDLKPEQVIFPDNAEYFIALGAAIAASGNVQILSDFIKQIETLPPVKSNMTSVALFENDEQLVKFRERHATATVKRRDLASYSGNAYLGIDAGSTTTKIILISEDNEILYEFYENNKGNPVDIIQQELLKLRSLTKHINIVSSCSTGYGEQLMQSAFGVDFGEVETVAHYEAAAFFEPKVDYLIDIGGQDMKCCHISNGLIDSILLNEACSSGCGSFIETFATGLGYTAKQFADLAIKSKNPVQLGTRCTVFMNSSVKQAQKENALVEDIAAGLAISVVKNALYKVIRITDPTLLGQHIVLQGGTFLNDAVLRAFEMELGFNVTRPDIAGMMGAFGAAIIAKKRATTSSTLLLEEELQNFSYKATPTHCRLCANNCLMTVNRFSNGQRLISGNKCERPVINALSKEQLPNMYRFKYQALRKLDKLENAKRKPVGIPLVLNIYDTLPYWHAFFTELDIPIELSDQTTKRIYEKGQSTIPSDTVCYPAKIIHGHIINLLEKGIETIFYPVMPFNNVEKAHADNHFNCPVVAHYPELLDANIDVLAKYNYLKPYVAFSKNDRQLVQILFETLAPVYPDIKKGDIKKAIKKGYVAYEEFQKMIQKTGEEYLAFMEEHNKPGIILAGRPYHIDPGINHGIDTLATSLGLVVLNEECVSHLAQSTDLNIVNQWTFHNRMYDSATFSTQRKNIEFVQLISFGCGLDAITSDELREILEKENCNYTGIKIDEISNLGAVKIRLRSLLAARDAQ